MTQGERIKLIRKEKNMTLEKFGAIIGVGKSAVSLIESGKNALSDRTAKSICREFDVNENWLRTGEGEMFKPKTEDEQIAEYVESILDHDEKENPFYDMVLDMVQTYTELDQDSRNVVLEFFRKLRKNATEKEG